MKTTTTITALFAAALILTPLTGIAQGQGKGAGPKPQERAQVERGQRDLDRDRLRDRTQSTAPERDRERIQDRTHAPDGAQQGEEKIYGGKLMTVQERNQYREQLRLLESDPEKRTQFKAQHQEKMQARARAQGVPFDELDDTDETD